MNIKSLLLGSAAALVAVSGAQAADAIVVEPEPVEYVRICDTYGTGFFYIPGTETCMRINGYLRSMYSHSDDRANAGEHVMRWRNRVRIQLDTRNETDWGTVRGWARLQSNSTPGAIGNFNADKMLISISGDNGTIRVGHLDHYFTTNHGYGGIGMWGTTAGLLVGSDDGIYAFNANHHLLDYTYSIDGLALTVGVSSNNGFTGAVAGNPSDLDMYAGFNYSGDGFTVAGTYVNEAVTNASDVSSWRVSASLDLSEFVPGGTLYGNYESTDDAASTFISRSTVGGLGVAAIAGARDSWLVGFAMDLADDLRLYAQYSELDYDTVAAADATSASVGVRWAPVSGLNFYGAYTQTEQSGVANDVSGFTFGVLRSF